mgnify:CR=1 FL=1
MEQLLRLSPKQNEFILNANHRFNLKVGAVRSGKSFVDTAFVVPQRLRERHSLKGLNFIIGVSTQTVERNVLQPMRELYTDALIGNIHSNTNIAMICGEPVYCIGAEKASQVSKIQGSSIKYAYGDEIAKWNKEVWEMLKSRLDKEYSCLDGSLNPESPTHYLKKFIDDPEMDCYIQHYTIFDNPFLPKKFVDNLCKEYEGTVYFKRYILGEWAQAEGLIFPNYEHAIGECPYILNLKNFKSMSNFCLSIDYGTLNAFACILWVKVDNVWWAWKDYYYSGRETGIQKTDAEYADELCKLVEPLFLLQKEAIDKHLIYESEKIEAIIDPSAASFITELRKRKIFKTRHADNNVEDGIRNTNTAINHDLIKVNKTLKNWIDEAGGYVWDAKKAEKDIEAPVKIKDHHMDSTRYFVRTKGLGRIKMISDGQYEGLLYSNSDTISMMEYF